MGGRGAKSSTRTIGDKKSILTKGK